MGIQRVGRAERFLQRVFVPLFILSGVIVASGFFFPDVIGEEISGRVWLTVALLFFGSGLGFLAVLPVDETDVEPRERDVHYFLRIRRLGWTGSIRQFLAGNDPLTFGVPVLALAGFFVLQRLAETQLLHAVSTVESVLTTEFGVLFVAVMGIAVVFSAVMLLGPWGDIRLGGPDTEPTYTYPIYFTMFFSAGIAAGIVFSGPASPVLHFGNPPPLFPVGAETGAAADAALTYALFHWGFTAWSAYLLLGLPIAYFVYEHGAPLRVSAILTPFVGVDGLDSIWSKAVDILAIFATIGGIATSVALISEQFLLGIDFQWGVSLNLLGPVLFVGGLAGIFVLSAQSGVHRGIRRISVVNISLFVVLGGLLFAVGPTEEILAIGGSAGTGFALNFVPMSLEIGSEWVATWTIYNWAWWLSWAPFAGLFLAALSRGRKIRTVVFTGVVATGLATMVWFVIVGGAALHLELTGMADILPAIDDAGNAVAGFPLLEALPLSELLMFLFLATIITFMTTSADTSTLVVAILASKREYAPTTAAIVFWGVFQGVVAITVLVTGSGELLQAAAVLTGGPFAIIGLLALVGLALGLQRGDRQGRGITTVVRTSIGRWRTRVREVRYDEDA